ncbi:type IV pilus assembly protein FimV [Thermomonas fusca]|uniref:type IV pilus assembly protein FimV n=1 Tax=Thermomonas fusca TaxID=215690 RepID=UPI00040A2ED6|nr:FimV/HubP family polar landmark protein [Thermomonas fusca]
MIGTLRTAVAAALLLAAGNAWALGLGQIQVKSKRNQPLLAEIPIVSTTPGELAALQARLASPETFRRVGLAPPSGVAADLQFSLGSDAKGRPVIRVTTIRPIEQPVLSFLIEVDWGAGRLVREYSALMDAPNTAGAVLPPQVSVPQTPVPALVQRPQPVAVASAPLAPAPVAATNRPSPAPAPAPARMPVEAPAPSGAVPVSQPDRAAPVAAAPISAFEPEPAAASMQYGPIKPGESLSKIASGMDLRRSFSLEQTMLALLQANPDAFLGDDVNRLRSGAVLRVPSREDVAKISAEEAAQVVRQQARQWRQARRAVRQPDAASAANAASAPAASKPAMPKPAPAANEKTPAVKPAAVAAAPKPAPAAAPRREDARLQIVPPTAPGKATGNKSGTSAGGEGSMLQQELRQRDEDIAAKSAEIGELKERLADLEKLKDEQQKLLSLKDSELAAAQARLAASNQAAQAKAAAVATKAGTEQAAPAEVADKGAMMPWLWGGLGVVVLALLAWLVAGRRKQAPAPRRSVFDSEALAAGMAAPTLHQVEPVQQDVGEEIQLDDARDAADAAAPIDASPAAEPKAHAEATIDMSRVVPQAEAETPAWHSSWMKVEPAAPVAPSAQLVAEQEAPVEVATDVAVAEVQLAEDDLPNLAAVPAQASPEQRFKLARAFLDVGDEFSAQQLLLELLDHEDEAVSDEAARMLSKLVG